MTKLRDGRGRSQRGSVLLYAIAVVLLVTILGTVLAAACTTMMRVSGRQVLDAKLLNAAESGAEWGLHQAAAGRSWEGERAVPVPGGSSQVSVRRLDGERWEIRSTTELNGRAREVRLEVAAAGPGRLRVVGWNSRGRPSRDGRARPGGAG